MHDSDFIKTLNDKRQDHLLELDKLTLEIDRLNRLVANIDGLLAEYINPISIGNFKINIPTKSNDKNIEIDISGLNLTEAILTVMKTYPDYLWRAVEIKNVLVKFGLSSNALSQKVSARLAERVKSTSNSQIKRIEGEDGFPRFKLRESYLSKSI